MREILLATKFTHSVILAIIVIASPLHASTEDASSGGPQKHLHVYLLIGQSNMAGRAPVPQVDKEAVPGCYLLNDKDQWEVARNPLNRYSTIRKEIGMQKMNPGYAFCKTMQQHMPDISIGLIVNARGGTKIEQWEKGGKYYNEALRRARTSEGTGTLKGILWHQGEGNAEDTMYLQKLERFITDLRTDLGNEKLIFVAGEINRAEEPVVNDQIARLPAKVPFTAVASSEGLKTMDRWHFDTSGMMILGQRYAEAILKLLNE